LETEVELRDRKIADLEGNYEMVLAAKLKSKREEFEFMKKELLGKMEAMTAECKAKLEEAFL
jgi:hypothetical protein